MYKFSMSSLEKLKTCDKKLQDLFNEVIKTHNCTVLCGHRGEKQQNEAYEHGKSKLKFPYSKHNTNPSIAIDVVPYFEDDPHIRWDDIESFNNLAKFVLKKADEMDIKITWGGSWAHFKDRPHYELK